MSILLQQQATSGLKPPRAWVSIVLAAWAASSFSPLFIGSFTPQPAGDNPPFGDKPWVPYVIAQWEPGPPQPYQRRITVVQGAPDQPYGSAVTVIDGDWDQEQPPRQARRLIPQGAVAVATQPSLSSSIGVIRLWWQAPDELPRQRALGLIVSVDNPPFAQRRSLPALQWDAPSWDAQRRDPLLVLVNDDPPFAARRPVPALAWDDLSWAAQKRPVIPQAAVAASDDPPFAQRRNPPALLWEYPSWDAQRRDPLLVLVNDDPPFSARRAPPALAWEASWWNAQARPITPQTPAAPVNDPPFAQRRNPPALLWEQTVWDAQRRDPLLVLVNDEPPYSSRRPPAALSWDAPSWDAQRRPYAPQTPVAAADNPPFGLRSWLRTTLDSWESVPELRRAPAKLAQAGAPDQPFSWFARLRHIVVDGAQEQWYKAAEKRKLAQGAPSQNPPFGAKPWKTTLVYAWQPGPPDILAPRGFRQIPPPTTQFDRSSAQRTYTITPELRGFVIQSQDRTITVSAEDRVFTVPEQERSLDI